MFWFFKIFNTTKGILGLLFGKNINDQILHNNWVGNQWVEWTYSYCIKEKQ